MSKRFTIKEFDTLTRDVPIQSSDYHKLPPNIFDQLEMFLLSRRQELETEGLELMDVGSKKGIGKVIRAKNYVGLIAMKDGTEIEILPKLFDKDDEDSEYRTKKLFLEMLSFLKEMPYKAFNISNLQIEKMTILEIYIKMFIQEVQTLVKKGLRSGYVTYETNEFFYKGKMKFSDHIKTNLIHKERFFIEYDLFSVNRSENKIIKTTLEFLRKISSSQAIKKELRKLMFAFEAVDVSSNVDQDFGQITQDRTMRDYGRILDWCQLFLQNKSFTSFKGHGVAYALLFPMEKVFENYVAGKLKKLLSRESVLFKTQDKKHHLFENLKQFLLKPDIVIQNHASQIILDTKWKRLSPNQRNFGISQSDMYQAYAYHKKYSAKLVILLYPWMEVLRHIETPILYQSGDNVTIQLYFIDLLDDNSINTIADYLLMLLRQNE